MRCPQCGTRDTRVVDSRDLDESATIRRRRECPSCTARFTTYERVEAARLVVVKRDGTRQEFDRDKLASGLAQGADPPARPRRRGGARRGRDRERAAVVGRCPRSRRRASARWRWTSCGRWTTSPTSGSRRVYQSFEDLEDLKREVDQLFDEGTPKKGKRAR